MDYHLLGTLVPVADHVAVFMAVYEIISDKTPVYSPTEFSSASWMYPHEIISLIKQGQTTKSDLPIVLGRFYLNNMRG